MAKSNNRAFTLVGIGILVLATGLLLWWVFSRDPYYNWSQRYLPIDKEPYDTYVLHTQLQESLGKDNFVDVQDTIYRKINMDSVPANSNILFIGNELYLDSAETKFMLDFVKSGHTAFLSADYFPGKLLNTLLTTPDEYQYYYNEHTDQYEYDFSPITTFPDTTISIGFERKELGEDTVHCTYIFEFEPALNSWRFFRNNLYSDDNKYVETIGTFNDTIVNFIRIPWGEGNFYLHSTPIVYTNYFLLNDKINNYALNSFSVLGDGKIYWDEMDRYYDPMSYDIPQGTKDKGPLVFLLSEPSLRSAWYLLLGASVLYLAFGAKRKQRIIPVMENMNNTSIEYAEVVSQLFMKEKDHKKLVLLKMELFKSYLRERFLIRIPTDSKLENEEFLQSITVKAHVPRELVNDIFEQYKYLSAIEVVETDSMLGFYHKVEEFYTRCK